MGKVIWVEVLSRHRDVVARHRCVGPEIRIGRGYGNDVVIDDAHVAPSHLRIFRDDEGALIAEDCGSLNGSYVDRDKRRSQRIALDGERLIRIGHTFLRIRGAAHVVAAESALQSQSPGWPRLLGLAVALLGLEGGLLWLGNTQEPKVLYYLGALLSLSVMVLGWTTGWAILSRLFTGQMRFERNLLIALLGLLGYSLYDEVSTLGAFAWSLYPLHSYEYVGMWLIIGALVSFHLREVAPARFRFKGAVVSVFAVIAIGMQTLAKSEGGARIDEPTYVPYLKPPALRLVAPHSEAHFFAEVDTLKPKLDKARAEEPDTGGGLLDSDADD